MAHHVRMYAKGIAFIIAAALASAAEAQSSAELLQRLERQLREQDMTYRLMIPQGQPISERLLVDYGVIARFGFYSIDDDEGTSHTLRQSEANLFLRAELDGAHRFFGQLRFRYDDWNSGDDFDGRGDNLDEPIGDRYWYEFDLRGAIQAQTGERSPYNVNVRAGKQFVQWGSGLALSEVIYAGIVDVEVGDLGFVGLAGLTPSTGTVDFDGSRPGFDSDTDRAFFGATFEYRGWATHRPYISFLSQVDHNDRNFEVFPVFFGDIPTEFEYDSHYIAVGSRGSINPRLRYRAEFVYQGGEGLSNSFNPATLAAVPQTQEDIDAWAAIAGMTYLLRDDRDSRFDVEGVIGSGDDDRIDSSDTFGGNLSGTDDNAFNSLGYVNTGLALAPDVSNLFSLRGGVSTNLLDDIRGSGTIRGGINQFFFWKVDSDAPISVRTEDGETFVGAETNFFLDWRLFSDVSLNVRYGLFLPGSAMPTGQDDPRHFVYAGVTYAF